METARLQQIREEEKKDPEADFEQREVYEEGSWIDNPTPNIIELIARLSLNEPLAVLDLGCGVGRNSIPLAKLVQLGGGHVHCVDLLEVALDKLKEYSKEYTVDDVISTEQADIGQYRIPADAYDYIVVASTLEHVQSEEVLRRTLRGFAEGTKSGGMNYIDMNTNIEEYDLASGRRRDVLVEVVLSKEKALKLLRANYEGWEEVHLEDKPIELEIDRNGTPVLFKANCLTFAVRKP